MDVSPKCHCVNEPSNHITIIPCFQFGSEDQEFVQPTPEEINASIQENLDRINDTFNNEIIDASWSGKTELELTELVTNHTNEGTTISEIACRGNTCRMEVLHDNINQSFDFE